ncbi:MAG: hypothetical protein IJZ45_10795 [Bacteroidaceae bacterium]|nr:hypothetical protein [Bacteroidaceae bacterium]
MELKVAQKVLEDEVKDEHTNVQSPLECKYATWKIINYLWASYFEKKNRGTQMDWLCNLYEEAGMSEENMRTFRLEIELLMETIERNPLKREKYGS